jgi:hypothetical protein
MGFKGSGSAAGAVNFGPASGSEAVGQNESDGVANLASRADHKHAFPPAASGSGSATSSPGDNQADGVSPAAARADHVHHRSDAYATTVVGPDAFGSSGAVGISTSSARADHHHGLPAQLTPATTVVGPDSFGGAAVVGISASYARSDHDHGLPAQLAAATTVVGPDTFGHAAGVGSSASFARSDHDHGLPAAPSTALTSAAGALGSNVSAVSGVKTLVMDTASLAAGTWLVMFGLTLSLGSTVGAASAIMEADSATATLAGQLSAQVTLGTSNNELFMSVQAIVTVTGPGTVKISVQATNTGTVLASTGNASFANASGYTAVKIA